LTSETAYAHGHPSPFRSAEGELDDHNKDRDDHEDHPDTGNPVSHAQEALDPRRSRHLPQLVLSLGGLRRERNSPRSGKSQAEAGEHYEVGVKRDLGKSANAERGERILVLQAAELSFHGGASTVEVFPPFGLTRDERVTTASLDPLARWLALTSRATELGGAALEVGTRKRPLAMFAAGLSLREAQVLLSRGTRSGMTGAQRRASKPSYHAVGTVRGFAAPGGL
jgi:hypothetical protein